MFVCLPKFRSPQLHAYLTFLLPMEASYLNLLRRPLTSAMDVACPFFAPGAGQLRLPSHHRCCLFFSPADACVSGTVPIPSVFMGHFAGTRCSPREKKGKKGMYKGGERGLRRSLRPTRFKHRGISAERSKETAAGAILPRVVVQCRCIIHSTIKLGVGAAEPGRGNAQKEVKDRQARSIFYIGSAALRKARGAREDLIP